MAADEKSAEEKPPQIAVYDVIMYGDTDNPHGYPATYPRHANMLVYDEGTPEPPPPKAPWVRMTDAEYKARLYDPSLQSAASVVSERRKRLTQENSDRTVELAERARRYRRDPVANAEDKLSQDETLELIERAVLGPDPKGSV